MKSRQCKRTFNEKEREIEKRVVNRGGQILNEKIERELVRED